MRDRVSFWSVLAEDTEREVYTEIATGPLHVAVSAADLAACVDALLGNVFAHTADGVSFAVRLAAREGRVLLVVDDDGPGFPDSTETGPLRRGSSGSGSTGLGLDIVRRAAVESGGEVTVETSPSGGGRVAASFGMESL